MNGIINPLKEELNRIRIDMNRFREGDVYNYKEQKINDILLRLIDLLEKIIK